MFKKESKKITSKLDDLSTYIESNDLYNAVLFDLIKDAYHERVPYEIRTFEFRPDLIAKDIYGSESYLGIFLLTCGVGLEGLYKGAIISILPKDVLNEIFLKLQRHG